MVELNDKVRKSMTTIKDAEEALERIESYVCDCETMVPVISRDFDIVRTFLTKAKQPEPVEGWRPIETAPKDGTEIIVWWKDQEIQIMAAYTDILDGEGFNWYSGHADYLPEAQLTHWIPLPEPPKGEE